MGDVHYMISKLPNTLAWNHMFFATGRKSLIFRSDALRWDIGTIRKKIYSFLAVSKNSKNRDYS